MSKEQQYDVIIDLGSYEYKQKASTPDAAAVLVLARFKQEHAELVKHGIEFWVGDISTANNSEGL